VTKLNRHILAYQEQMWRRVT